MADKILLPMAAIFQNGRHICYGHGPTYIKNVLKDLIYLCEQFHAFIVKPTIIALIRSTNSDWGIGYTRQ